MNLIEFVVTEIIEERYDVLYKLLDMTEEEAIENGERWLFHQGCYQRYKFVDIGGEYMKSTIHDTTNGCKPYTVGSKDSH